MKEIILDGKLVRVPVSIKSAVSEENKAWNKEQSKDIYKPYYIFNKNDDGTYTTNQKGIIPTVFMINEDFSEMVVLEILPLENLPSNTFNELTKSDTYPNGLDFDEFFDDIKSFCDYRKWPSLFGKNILTSPVSIKLFEFSEKTKLHPDTPASLDFWGVMKHPITKERILILKQWGICREYWSNIFNTEHPIEELLK